MLAKLATVFRVQELRRKILLTIVLLAVYRLGFHVTLPFMNHAVFKEARMKLSQESGGVGGLLQQASLFAASDLQSGSIFGLGIMPYITASIVFQLLGTVYPPLEALQKEGESGRRKLNEYTRYATVIVCLLQSFFLLKGLAGGAMGSSGLIFESYRTSMMSLMFGTIVMTAGTVLLMWIGEQIDAYGLGNGISLLIMAGILARLPDAFTDVYAAIRRDGIGLGSDFGIEKLLVMAAIFVGVIVVVVFITQGQRKIPIQSAKHVRGRRVMGGNRQWLPLRVNQAGVMPIIFASSLLLIPFFVFTQAANLIESDIVRQISAAFQPGGGFVYSLAFICLIYFFCYFWTAITFNPKDMAENLKDNGSFIPGYRPGGRTAAHLEQVMVRITYVGAAFLAVIAVIPTIVSNTIVANYATAQFFGGTGLLIIVSVALDLVQKVDSHLVMRNYPGLLDAEK
ncbi:MAG: preprotein translocase subunit SecY [Planctomycetaceae bacterium]|nr:preprotein translocase subunit SecY [Planctomycetaceae bacterium]